MFKTKYVFFVSILIIIFGLRASGDTQEAWSSMSAVIKDANSRLDAGDQAGAWHVANNELMKIVKAGYKSDGVEGPLFQKFFGESPAEYCSMYSPRTFTTRLMFRRRSKC